VIIEKVLHLFLQLDMLISSIFHYG